MRATALLLLLLPVTAHAEVMDKESSAAAVWAWATAPCVIAYLAARYRPWLLLLVLPAPVLFYIAHLLEVTDRYVGPAIAREAGTLYLVASWGGPDVPPLSVAVGFRVRG